MNRILYLQMIGTAGKEAIDAWIREHYAADRPEFYPPTEKSGYTY